MTANAYYNTNQNPLPNNTSPYSQDNFHCAKIQVSPGEKYRIFGKGGAYALRMYGIGDSNNAQLALADNNLDASRGYDITIPADGAMMVINFKNYDSSTDKLQKYVEVDGVLEDVKVLSDEVVRQGQEIDNLDDPVYSDPLQGVTFPDSTPTSIREAITKVWLSASYKENVDKVVANAPILYLTYISNATGNYRPLVMFNLPNAASVDDQVFSGYLNSQSTPRNVKEVFACQIRNPYKTDWGISDWDTKIYIEIDWSKVSGTNYLAIELDVAKMNKKETNLVHLSDIESTLVQNSLTGKNIVCFGDSITELADTQGWRYSDYIAGFSNANVINVGIGGSQLRQRAEPVDTPTSSGLAYAALDVVNMVDASVRQDFTKQVAAAEYLRDHESDDNTAIVARLQAIDWSKVDIVTFFAGTNDWYGGGNAGESGSVSKSTTLGAINYIIQNLLPTYPHVKIFWFTPVVRYVSYSGGSGTPANFGDNYVANGNTLKQFSELIKTEVELSHIPVCDLYNTLGWNMWNFKNYFTDNDGTHPRKPAGMQGIAARMFAFILSHKNSL